VYKVSIMERIEEKYKNIRREKEIKENVTDNCYYLQNKYLNNKSTCNII